MNVLTFRSNVLPMVAHTSSWDLNMGSILIIALRFLFNVPNVWRSSPRKMLVVIIASETFRQKFKPMRQKFRSKMRQLLKSNRTWIKSWRCSKVNKLSKNRLNRTFFGNLNNHSSLHTSRFLIQVNQASTDSFRIREPQTSDTIRVLWEANKLSSLKRIIRSSVRIIPSLGRYLRPAEALESSTSAIIAALFYDPCHSKTRYTSAAACVILTFARGAPKIITPLSTPND